MDDPSAAEPTSKNAKGLMQQIPIEVTISVGKARPRVRDLLMMAENSILPLDRRIDDPVELFVGDRLIARGELQEMSGQNAGQLSVRLTEVVNEPTETE